MAKDFWHRRAPRDQAAGIDPYLDWVFGPGRVNYVGIGQDEWLPVLLELRGTTPAAFQEAEFLDGEAKELWQESFRALRLYTHPPIGLESLPFCGAQVRVAFFKLLQLPPVRKLVARLALGPPLPSYSLSLDGDQGELQPAAGGVPAKVVVGIIDDGICFAHERFRDGRQTRVEAIWLQDGAYRGPVAYGRDLRKAEIDQLLTVCTRAGSVDEEELYRRAGQTDFARPGHKPSAWRRSHGTHILDLAAGCDASARLSDRPIVGVQLPVATTADTSGVTLATYASAALRYILACADLIGAAQGGAVPPVVINFSYGIIAGPHDGTSLLEDEFDQVLRARRALGLKTELVLPAGNSFLARCHAEVAFKKAGDWVTFDWRILPDDRTPSFIEIWLPPPAHAGAKRRIRLRVTPPGGTPSPPLVEGDTAAVELALDPASPVSCMLSFAPAWSASGRGMFVVAVNATASLDTTVPLARAGTWRVTLENVSLTPAEVVHAWIQRDDTPYGYPHQGRQSFFHEPSYRRFCDDGHLEQKDDPNNYTLRANTLNAIATGNETVVVGGFHRKEMVACAYSASGPAHANRTGPEALTISDDSLVHRGVLAAGSRSGSVVAMGGTSAAAGQLTRIAADELAAGKAAGRQQIRALAVADEARPGQPPGKPSNERGGGGRIRRSPLNPLSRMR